MKNRREFLQQTAALAAASLPTFATGALVNPTPYNPAAKLDIKVSDVPFRKTAKGRQLMARVYQPNGPGAFPVLLDLHGGAWNNKDRTANEPMDRAVAASGVLVVAIDMTLAGEAPYPANVQDANYGVRWLKHKAREWNGDPSTVGILGSSTGGHMGELIAMKPRDPKYAAIPLAEEPRLDATILYLVSRSPISDPVARFQQAEKMKRDHMIKNNQNYWKPWDTIKEGNPQYILDRKEHGKLPPLLILQGALDDNVLPAIQEKFVASYRAAGGDARLEIFEGCEHEWVAKPGPQTDRAHEMVKQFIARNLTTLRRAA
ncbi:MAG TPA: alpha/beta hydrolase [Burkholderiales bacterium]|nr:alpha/beta hydrolase [Burkholderiales bacterium]